MFLRVSEHISRVHLGHNPQKVFRKERTLKENLKGDWTNLLSVTSRAVKSDFFVYCHLNELVTKSVVCHIKRKPPAVTKWLHWW